MEYVLQLFSGRVMILKTVLATRHMELLGCVLKNFPACAKAYLSVRLCKSCQARKHMQRKLAQATGSKHVQAWNSAPSLEPHAELMAVLSKPCVNPHEQPYNSVDKQVHSNEKY